MGAKPSKEELLYQQVSYGNTEFIKALYRDGAGLEWSDTDGKTALIVACMKPELYKVVNTLLQLGANVHAYRPGPYGGTPLHYAAGKGIENTVHLLISYGANVLATNDDGQTPLEVARAKGYTKVVRAIEKRICLFSGWLREFYGPGILQGLAPQLFSRKLWVVVLPTGSCDQTKPLKLELAIYHRLQDIRPQTVIALWEAKLEEPNYNQSDPSVTILVNSTGTCIKLVPSTEGDKQQLQSFCNACKGIPQVNLASPSTSRAVAQVTASPDTENLDLGMAINASSESATAKSLIASASTSWTNNSSQQTMFQTPAAIPSAPPVADEIIEDRPIQYPSIDLGPVDIPSPTVGKVPAASTSTEMKKDGVLGSSCVICLDGPVEGACVPCGHMAGCMSCLNEVEAKKSGCPVCRASINQVIRLYVA